MKKIILVILLFTAYNYASAQDVYTSSGKQGYQKKTRKKKGYDPDKLIIGGGLNLSVGGGYTDLGISPIVGYRITNHFAAGIGIGYLFAQTYDGPNPYDPNKNLYISENIVYPNVWARYFVYRSIYVTSTFEHDFIFQKYPLDNYGNENTTRINVSNECLWLGVGMKFPTAGRVSFYGEIIYDVLQGVNSPYLNGSPDIRFGVAAGL